jgi:hypothetical protein
MRRMSEPKAAVSAFSMTDRQFLKEFAMPQVAAALHDGNNEAAKQLVLRHYALRRIPAWPDFPARFTSAAALSEEELLRQARDVLEHRFGAERIWLGEKIDWQYNPTTDLRARWTREIHRHRWMAVLACAYIRTSDARYAQKFVELSLDWIRSNPMPLRKDEANVAWTLMAVGMRGVIWPAAFGSFYAAPAFTDEAKFIMLRSIHDHAQFLSRFKTHLNHVLRESNGLASLGIYFPEFSSSEQWRRIALARLEQELLEQVNPDGSSVEMSCAYQWLVTDEYGGAREMLKRNDLRLPSEDIDSWMAKLYQVLAYVLRPDGVWPRLDDGFMEHDDVQLDKLATAGEQLNRQDIVYIATRGAYGEQPKHTSIAFKDAGLYIMRSDWGAQARYMLMDAGPFAGPHGHEDKLSIELSAYGQPFIVDPGCYTYNSRDPYRAYFASSRAHSTAMLAGKSQIRRWNQDLLRPKAGRREAAVWVSEPAFDYVEGAYRDGYASFQLRKPRDAAVVSDVVHVRKVLFVKPTYWLIVDELSSTGGEHDYEVLFNLAPSVQVKRTALGMRLDCDGNEARLYLAISATDSCEINCVSGATDPIQGWYADGWQAHKLPTTSIICTVKKTRFAVLTTLLYPCVGEHAPPALQPQEISGGAGRAYRVISDLGMDYLMLSSNDDIKTLGPFESNASLAGFRARPNEEPVPLFSWH